jgi:hypothetical protein
MSEHDDAIAYARMFSRIAAATAPPGAVLLGMAEHLIRAEGPLDIGAVWMRGIDAGLRLALAEPERSRALLAAMDAEIAAQRLPGQHDCTEHDAEDLAVYRALLADYEARAVAHD